MDRSTEVAKLISVLYRIASGAGYVARSGEEAAASWFCARQYNRVLARLTELEPAVAQAFTPLPENASPEVVRIAARELAAYFEDEAPRPRRAHYASGCGGAVWFGWPGSIGCWRR
jgi:hypothetical protein